MGNRDYRHKETKKTKKAAVSLPPISVSKVTPRVEVIKKVRKKKEEEEGE